MKLTKRSYAAVRKTEGREWFSMVYPCIDTIRQKEAEKEKACGPAWAKDNPLQRVVEVEVTEL